MHIALDLRMVGPQLHGIARYALELGRRLPALAPGARFDLLVAPDFDPLALGPALPNVRLVTAHSRFLSAAEQAELPLLLDRLGPDLYHSTSFSVPLGYRGPMALTLHDANHLAFPEHYGRFHGLYYRSFVRPGALRARAVFTVSSFAQEEIERRLSLPRGRVQVIYNGVDGLFCPPAPAQVEEFRRRHGLPARFVLYVGNTKPHKNVGLLLAALSRLPSDVQAVLCAGPKVPEALLARAGDARGRVRALDVVPDTDLPLLYAAAAAFAFPSRYEGFGLPPLEAMACGTPVVASRASALPEVLGDAAELVDPDDVPGFAAALSGLLAGGPRVDELRRAGLARAARFSWDDTARSILSAYQGALEPFRARSAVPGPRGASHKVLFCVRSNLWSLPGGDATQILRTRAALEEQGVDVALWSQPQLPAHGSYDLAHLFHLTRLDTFVHARALERAQLPFVLSTIYWPTTEFEQRGQVGALRLLHGTLSTGPADVAKNAVRAVLAEGDWRRAMLPEALLPLEHRMSWLLSHARLLLPNSQAEGDVLRRLGGTAIHPVVNASDAPPEARPSRHALPERFILCAGRIEPRKNQLALAEAMAGFPLPLLLVGDPGPMHGSYFRRLAALAGPGLRLLPALPRDELFAVYAAAEVHVAPAWYETPGLVSLEAAAAGTRVVTTDRGSTCEYFGDDACYLDPADPASMRRAVEESLSRPRASPLRERVLREYTWERAGEQTLAAYRAALARGAT